MSNVFYIVMFVLSIIITHSICKGLNFFGTTGGIIKLKFGIWIVVFFCLGMAANATGIAPAAETNQELSSDEEYEDNEENIYDSNEEYDKKNKNNINKKNKKYILPNSSKKKLTKSDLKGLSKKELRLARNEIYARHGRIFQDEELQSYFESTPWYEGIIPAEEFSDSEELNDIERKNVLLIQEYENQ